MAKRQELPVIDLQADLVQLTPAELAAWREVLTLSWPLYKAVTINVARSRALAALPEPPGAGKMQEAGKIAP